MDRKKYKLIGYYTQVSYDENGKKTETRYQDGDVLDLSDEESKKPCFVNKIELISEDNSGKGSKSKKKSKKKKGSKATEDEGFKLEAKEV